MTGAEGRITFYNQAAPELRDHRPQLGIASEPSFSEPRDGQLDLQGKRILVIEDEPLVAMDLESSLTAAGCKVVGPAGTLERARALVADADYDAALVDVNLAGEPVDELATALTQKNRPFAFVTGHGREGLPRGFQEALVLGKPFSQEQLLAAVGLLLHQRAGVVPLRQTKK